MHGSKADGEPRVLDLPQPRWVIAFKFTRKSRPFCEKLYSGGSYGVPIPAAELDPSTVAGSTIVRANLHNLTRFVVKSRQRRSLSTGGDVIPEVTR